MTTLRSFVLVTCLAVMAACGIGGTKRCTTRTDCPVGEACGPDGACTTETTSSGGTGTGGGTGGNTTPVKRVFVTATAYAGDLKTAGNAADGLAGGDALCNLTAQAQNLGGTWVAWLSSSSASALSRVPEVGPWYVVRANGNRSVAVNNKANLQTSPQTGISVDERGNDVSGLGWNIWTGTIAGGGAAPTTCDNWTHTQTSGGYSLYGQIGEVGSNSNTWTANGEAGCTGSHHLLCFEK